MVQLHFTPKPSRSSNPQITTLLFRYHHAQNISIVYVKVRKSAQLDIFALLFHENRLMKQNLQFETAGIFFNEQIGVQYRPHTT